MAKTVQYLKRIAESHKTDHELCDTGTCPVAAKKAEEYRQQDNEWAEQERKLDIKALLSEIREQDLDPADFFVDLAAVEADIADLDEEPDIVSHLRARLAIRQYRDFGIKPLIGTFEKPRQIVGSGGINASHAS